MFHPAPLRPRLALALAVALVPATAAHAAGASPAPGASTRPAGPGLMARPSAMPTPQRPTPRPSPVPSWYGPQERTPPGGYPRPVRTPSPEELEAKDKVVELVVRGNRMIGEDRILLMVPFLPGDSVGTTKLLDAEQRVRSMGYFQEVRARTEPVPGGVRVLLMVAENPPCYDVMFEGVTKLEADKLREHFKPLIGEVINYNLLREGVAEVEKDYQNAGFPLARVVDLGLAGAGLVRLRVAEGRVARILVRGQEETQPHVVLREMATKPGDVLYAPRLRDDLRRVMNLNFFEDVQPRFEASEEPEAATLVIQIKEKQTGSVNAGAGYNTRDGIVGLFSVKKDNILGTGRSAAVDFSISQQLRLSGELNFYEPWLDEAHTGLGLNVYARRFNNFLADFREDRNGGSFNLSRPLLGDAITSQLRGSLGLRLEQVNTFDNVFIGGNSKPRYLNGTPITLTPSGHDWVSALSAGLVYDTRDLVMNPTEGQFHSLTLDPGVVFGPGVGLNLPTTAVADPGASTPAVAPSPAVPANPAWAASPLLRAQGFGTYFLPLWTPPWSSDRSTLAMHVRAGLTMGPQVPAYERFFSTGPYLIRGYPEFVALGSAALAQYPLNYFQGANVAVGSLEYRFPLVAIAQGVLFADSGLFWDQKPDLSLLHSGFGAGVRLTTPLGPIRLDYGWNGFDPVGQIHFAIGQKF